MATIAARSRRDNSRGSVSNTAKTVGQRRVAGWVRNLDRLTPAGDDGEQLGVLQGLAFGTERQRAPRIAPDDRNQRERAARRRRTDEQQVCKDLPRLADTIAVVAAAAVRTHRVLASQVDHAGAEGPAGDRKS
jgi:hypothetical protein